ncbi:MAG: hypothetical protein JO317_05935 [Verrucomicrobiae bacterium]|nr:hypothetical protein [Verrucomicrobiae bacterium]
MDAWIILGVAGALALITSVRLAEIAQTFRKQWTIGCRFGKKHAVGLTCTALILIGVCLPSSFIAMRMRAEAAATSLLAGASDGPWNNPKSTFILSGEHSTFQWVFRFQNPKTGLESKRVFVDAISARPYVMADDILDPIPFVGVLPD